MSGKAVPVDGQSEKDTKPVEDKRGRSANGRFSKSAAGDLPVGKADEAPILTEHAATGRLLAQRGLYSGPSDVVSKDLYGEVIKGVAARQRDAVSLEPAAFVSGNTYFGRFPASYWQRWTAATEVTVDLTVTGDGHAYIGASDSEGEPRRVATRAIVGAKGERITLTAKIDQIGRAHV